MLHFGKTEFRKKTSDPVATFRSDIKERDAL